MAPVEMPPKPEPEPRKPKPDVIEVTGGSIIFPNPEKGK